MVYPTNLLQTVATYVQSGLPLLINHNAAIATFNTQYENFQNLPANLGSTVNISLPYKFIGNNGLVVSWQGVQQNLHPITCDQAINVPYTHNSQEYIFNLGKDGYMKEIARGAIAELGARVEGNVMLNANSSVPVMSLVNGQSVPTGALHTESGPYRCYGTYSAGVTQPINSFKQLANMVVKFKNTGMAQGPIDFYIPDTVPPDIIDTGANQFAPKRADDTLGKWDLGSWGGSPDARYYTSNLLPIQNAGTCGNSAQTLTVVSTVTDSSGAVIAITFSGATASDANAVKAGDIFTIADTSTQKPRFLVEYGHLQSAQPIQFRSLTDVQATAGGQVTVSILPGLQALPGANQNINMPIVAGMTATVFPSHRCGLIVAAKAAYLVMPKLGSVEPFPSHSESDPETKVSMRMYYGALFGQNQQGLVHDCIWASTVVPKYCMRIAFPITN